MVGLPQRTILTGIVKPTLSQCDMGGGINAGIEWPLHTSPETSPA